MQHNIRQDKTTQDKTNHKTQDNTRLYNRIQYKTRQTNIKQDETIQIDIIQDKKRQYKTR